MPHIPRRYANTTGMPPELMTQPKAQHPPIPIRDAQEEQKPPRLRLGLEQMNLRTWEPDFALSVYKPMFGKEPTIDPITQQLVLAPNAPAAAAFGAQQPRTPNVK